MKYLLADAVCMATINDKEAKIARLVVYAKKEAQIFKIILNLGELQKTFVEEELGVPFD